MAEQETKYVNDVRSLRAITHPLRARLLGHLRLEGPATATELGRRTDESSGATSYHLRQLERFGFVEEMLPREGRERRWRATTRSTSWQAADFVDDPAALAVSDALERRQLARAFDQFEAWLSRRKDVDPTWLRAAEQADAILRLTPGQARALTHEMLALWRRFRDDPPATNDEETGSFVALYFQMLPVERLEELDR